MDHPGSGPDLAPTRVRVHGVVKGLGSGRPGRRSGSGSHHSEAMGSGSGNGPPGGRSRSSYHHNEGTGSGERSRKWTAQEAVRMSR